MKKIIAIMLAMILLLGLCSCGKKEEKTALEEIKEKGFITIATEGVWAPYTYHDDNDKLTGFDVELGRLIAKGLGVEAKFEETPWDSILAGIDSGRFDIACNGVGYTDDRAEKYNMSTPYLYMGTALVVAKDNTDINSFEDLKGKVTANTASSTYAQIAEKYGATVTPVDDLSATIKLVTDGRIDGTVNAVSVINDYLGQHPDAAIRIAVIDNETVEMNCIPVAKGEKYESLHAEINKILAELAESGELSKLSIQFFGADYTKK